MSDYIFPNKLAQVLRKPSERTQLEASLVGLTLIIIGSLGVGIYFIFFTDMSLLFKICIGLSCIGIFLFQTSTLVTTYIQYYVLKTALGLYKQDMKGGNEKNVR